MGEGPSSNDKQANRSSPPSRLRFHLRTAYRGVSIHRAIIFDTFAPAFSLQRDVPLCVYLEHAQRTDMSTTEQNLAIPLVTSFLVIIHCFRRLAAELIY